MSRHVIISRVVVASVLLGMAAAFSIYASHVTPSHVLVCDYEFGFNSYAQRALRQAVTSYIPDWRMFDGMRPTIADDTEYRCQLCLGVASEGGRDLGSVSFWQPIGDVAGVHYLTELVQPHRMVYVSGGPIATSGNGTAAPDADDGRWADWRQLYVAGVQERWLCSPGIQVSAWWVEWLIWAFDRMNWVAGWAWRAVEYVVVLATIAVSAAVVVDGDRRTLAQRREWYVRWWWTGELRFETDGGYVRIPIPVQWIDDIASAFGLLTTGWNRAALPMRVARREYRRRASLVRQWSDGDHGIGGEIAERVNRMVAWLDGDHAADGRAFDNRLYCDDCVDRGEASTCNHCGRNWTRMPERAAMEGVFAARARFNVNRTDDSPANRDAVFAFLRAFFGARNMRPEQLQASIYLANACYWVVSDADGELHRRFRAFEEYYSINRMAPAAPRL